MRATFLVCGLLVSAGCDRVLGLSDPVAAGGDDGGDLDGGDVDAPVDSTPGPDAEPASTGCRRVDLLFMIDNSASMLEEQGNLTAAIPAFMEVLTDYRTPDDEPLDYRIAVATPGRDLDYTITLPGFPPITQHEEGEDGVYRRGCGLDRAWIQADDPDPTALFECRAEVGKAGGGTEMPLYALKLATDERVDDGNNAGFLRATAPLVVVIITDEDDCSREDNNFESDPSGDICHPDQLQPVTRYQSYLDTLKGSRDLWAMAVVANPGPAECSSDFGTAAPALRLAELAGAEDDNVTLTSICTGNLALALDQVLDLTAATCGD